MLSKNQRLLMDCQRHDMISTHMPQKPAKLINNIRKMKKYQFNDGVELFEANLIRGILQRGYMENQEVQLPEIEDLDPTFWLIQKEFRENEIRDANADDHGMGDFSRSNSPLGLVMKGNKQRQEAAIQGQVLQMMQQWRDVRNSRVGDELDFN